MKKITPKRQEEIRKKSANVWHSYGCVAIIFNLNCCRIVDLIAYDFHACIQTSLEHLVSFCFIDYTPRLLVYYIISNKLYQILMVEWCKVISERKRISNNESLSIETGCYWNITKMRKNIPKAEQTIDFRLKQIIIIHQLSFRSLFLCLFAFCCATFETEQNFTKRTGFPILLCFSFNFLFLSI